MMERLATADRHARWRGPDPPHKVCPTCGSVSAEAWENPLLVTMREIGWYTGEVTGGAVVCELCDVSVRCQTCRDTGWEWVKYRSKRGGVVDGVKRCQCAEEQRIVEGLPIAYMDAMLINFELGEGRNAPMAAARRWLGGEVADLYIRGGVGVGKTRLLASLLNESKADTSTAFVRVGELLDQARSRISQEGGYEDYLRRYRSVGVLGLDDLGAEKGSDFARRLLLSLYESRTDHGKRTIITSNLSLGDLEEFLGDERLSSRIAGQADVVVMGGRDQRV